MLKLSDQIERKFVEQIDVSDWEVETDSGWAAITSTNKTVPYEIYTLRTTTGRELKCADTHILFDSELREIFAKDTLNKFIQTEDGLEEVIYLVASGIHENMYDLSVDSEDHRYYTNGFLSHNTTTSAAYILWYTLFQANKTVAILANKKAAAMEVLDRYQTMYEALPSWLQQGVTTWNKGDIKLENGSKVFTAATTASGIRGKSVNMLYIDEAAIIPNTVADQFFASVYPTISAGETTKILLSSTPMGYNHFWKFWDDADNNRNGFVNHFIPYWEIPGRDKAWADQQRAMLGDLKYAQEIECSWLGSSSTLISGDALSKLKSSVPLYKKDGLDAYYRPVAGRTYCIVADVSKGVGGDYSAFQVIDITETPYKVVAKYRDNKISPLLYPSILYKIGKEYNDAYMLIEVNISEQVAYILYNELEYENLLMVGKDNKGQKIGGVGAKYGVVTDKKVKRLGCDNIKMLIEENKILINDMDTIAELTTFIEHKGSYAADDGYHDDLVMPLVLFGWLTTQPYFKDLSDLNLRELMYKQRIEAIEDELTPFGFYNDGKTLQEDASFNF